jgi:hypothetical protein
MEPERPFQAYYIASACAVVLMRWNVIVSDVEMPEESKGGACS